MATAFFFVAAFFAGFPVAATFFAAVFFAAVFLAACAFLAVFFAGLLAVLVLVPAVLISLTVLHSPNCAEKKGRGTNCAAA